MILKNYNQVKIRQEITETLEQLKKLTVSMYNIQMQVDNLTNKYTKLMEQTIEEQNDN